MCTLKRFSLFILFLCFFYPFIVFSSPHNVDSSDKRFMPDLSGYNIVFTSLVRNISPNDAILHHYHDKNDNCAFNAVFLVCNGVKMKQPFVIFDYKLKFLYIDSDFDRKVDKFFNGSPYPSALSVKPECLGDI